MARQRYTGRKELQSQEWAVHYYWDLNQLAGQPTVGLMLSKNKPASQPASQSGYARAHPLLFVQDRLDFFLC